jgi:hypothetical protein
MWVPHVSLLHVGLRFVRRVPGAQAINPKLNMGGRVAAVSRCFASFAKRGPLFRRQLPPQHTLPLCFLALASPFERLSNYDTTRLFNLTVYQIHASMFHGFRALRAGLCPQRSRDRPACLQTGYPYTLQRQFLSLFFSIHLPPIVPVVPQREPSYPLSFHSLANYFFSNRGVHPPPHSNGFFS